MNRKRRKAHTCCVQVNPLSLALHGKEKHHEACGVLFLKSGPRAEWEDPLPGPPLQPDFCAGVEVLLQPPLPKVSRRVRGER